MSGSKQSLWILLGEDDPENIFLIKEMLRGTGLDLRITVAENGHKAMDMLNRTIGGERHIDLVLLDLNLPEVNGFDVLSYVRSMRGLKDIPVVVMAKAANIEKESRAKSLGATYFMVKPSDHREFQAIIDRIKELLARPRDDRSPAPMV